MPTRLATLILWVVTLFYAYGASMHVLNMASLTGFDWSHAPRKWQLLDVAYLLIDTTVVAGLFRRWRVSVAVFYLAALSQLVLYTALKEWVLEVPASYVGSSQRAYLSGLVLFHVFSLALVTWAVKVLNRPTRRTR